MTLVIQFPLAGKLTDQSFSTEKTADQAMASLPDIELEGVFESDDMAGIDGVATVDINGMDRAVATQEQIARPSALDPEHRFPAEQCG